MIKFFRPVLLAALAVILFETVFILPIPGMAFIGYFAGGVLAVYFFKSNQADKFREVSWQEAMLLGLFTGLIVAGVLTLVYIISLQNQDLQVAMIEAVNKATRMHSRIDSDVISRLGVEFYIAFALVTFIVCCVSSLFGSLAAFPFVNKGKK